MTRFSEGVHVTSIVPPEQGWPVLYHCEKCARSTFLLVPWAAKPEHGDYWRISLCPDEPRHNMDAPVWGSSLLEGAPL